MYTQNNVMFTHKHTQYISQPLNFFFNANTYINSHTPTDKLDFFSSSFNWFDPNNNYNKCLIKILTTKIIKFTDIPSLWFIKNNNNTITVIKNCY